jgi:hypothetical protein
MSCLDSIGSNQLIILGAVFALAISDDLSADDLNILGNFIVAVGSLILTKAAQVETQDAKQDIKEQICDLENRIQKLKKGLN